MKTMNQIVGENLKEQINVKCQNASWPAML